MTSSRRSPQSGGRPDRSTRRGAGQEGRNGTPPPPKAGGTRSPQRSRRPITTRRSFLERNRSRLVVAAGVAALVLVGAFVYVAATTPAYACGTLWTPAPTASPAPGATQRLGYVQDDMGRNHVQEGTTVTYALCPPASGNHVNITGEGPIRPGVYGPQDKATPEGWIHNLEHGGLVLLYKCPGADACTDAGQAALRQLYQSWPNSPICGLQPGVVGPIFARFDDMKWPYAALLWNQVLPLDSLDTQTILAFFQQQGERYNPEKQCAAPSPTPGASSAPTGSPAATAAPASPAPSGTPKPS